MNENTCCLCDRQVEPEALVVFDGQIMCLDCLNQHTIICFECGNRIWEHQNAGTGERPLCQHCADRYYVNCCQCGAQISQSDAYYESDDGEDPYCESCFQQLQRGKPIRDYYFKPAPKFHGTGNRYFGVELEIDGAGEYRSNALKLLDIANTCEAENLYIKHDGSLEEGFELVTHPMTLEYHLKEMPWEEVLHEAAALGYFSHQTTTCGLHVHISRKAFGDTQEEQDTVIARFLFFFEKMWNELLKFSRRTPRQLERWAARYGYRECPKELLEQAKKGCSGRYVAVNLQNQDTIEVRIFRGTLKYSTLVATLQLLDRICDVVLALDDDELKNLSWSAFAAGCEAAELVQYLKVKRLYVNEPVTEGRDL